MARLSARSSLASTAVARAWSFSIAASRIKQLVAPETPAAEPNKPDLIAALRACKSMADLEKHRDAVSLLRGKEKTTAIAAWKEVKATLDGSTPPVDTEASAE